MITLTVIKAFNDKYTDEFYPIGTVITVDDDRGNELLSNNLELVELVELVETITDKPRTKKPKKA